MSIFLFEVQDQSVLVSVSVYIVLPLFITVESYLLLGIPRIYESDAACPKRRKSLVFININSHIIQHLVSFHDADV